MRSNLLFNRGRRRPVALAAANLKQKVSQNLRAERRMRDFRMKLNSVNTERRILESVNCVFRCGGDDKTFRHRRDVIAVTHPNVHFAAANR